MREQLARALEVPDYWLDMDPEGEPIPVTLLPLTLARSLNLSPADVRGWHEDDALDQILWLEVEGRRSVMRQKEMERNARSR